MTESSPSSQPAEPDSPSKNSRPGRHRKLLLVIVALVFTTVGVGYAGYWYFVGRNWVGTADAYVHGNLVSLMPQVTGTVTAVNADDTEFVHRGDVLVQLDPTDARLAVHRAAAKLADTVRSVRRLYQEVPQLQASVRVREADLEQARDDFHRAKRLRKSGNVSEQDYQHAATAWHAAQANLSQARHQLAALQAQTEGTDLHHHPQVRLAATALRQAYVALARTRIVAPVTGYVAQRTVQVGQEVAPGKPLLAVIPLNEVWVVANFKETVLAPMRVGQPVMLTADLYGSSVQYHGKVQGINPGTGSSFELLPPQNATGNWIKVVRRVPVRIGLRQSDLKKHPLRLGLSMQVSVDVHNVQGTVLGEAAAGQSHYSTDVYQHAGARAEQRIEEIIAANASGETYAKSPADSRSPHAASRVDPCNGH